MLRRRLSNLSRMTFRVATDCLADEKTSPVQLFCSRYGEYGRKYNILSSLSSGESPSAMAFSMSVHNTSASLFSIDRQDTANSTSLAGGEATLETAFVEAWSLLTAGEASSVLVVYHDEPLPEIYREQITTVAHPAAIALLLRLPNTAEETLRVTLDWSVKDQDTQMAEPLLDPALRVLRLILSGGDSVTNDTGRLIWNWGQNSAAT
jgi:hypothetical protein